MKFIENLVFQEKEFRQYTGEFIRAISTPLCEHFAAKEVAYKIIDLKEKEQIKELSPVHPTISRFAEIVSNPEEDETTKNLLTRVNDMLTNIGKTKKKNSGLTAASLCLHSF